MQADGFCLPLADGCIDLVVLHQVLEHFGCGEAAGMLRECRRVLKVGGSVIATVPDIKALARRWLVGQTSDYIMFVNCCGAYQGLDEDRHKWHYTRESLAETLEAAGFRHPAPFNWRQIPGADIARDWWILGMEAVR